MKLIFGGLVWNPLFLRHIGDQPAVTWVDLIIVFQTDGYGKLKFGGLGQGLRLSRALSE